MSCMKMLFRYRSVTGSFAIVALALSMAIVFWSCDLDGMLKQGSTKKSAILYGITLYDGPGSTPGFGNNLSYPVNDVVSFRSILSEQGWNIVSRTDAAATHAQLKADIDSVTTNAEAGERILFYYSGHGIDKAGDLVPVDAIPDPTKLVSPVTLAAWFQPLIDKGANLVLILDSCFSGRFVSTGTYTTNLPDDYNSGLGTADSPASNPAFFQSITDYFANSNDSGAQSLPLVWSLSAAGLESSYDSFFDKHGAFSAALLDGLKTTSARFPSDYNADGYVTLSELGRYTSDWLDSNWNNQNIKDEFGNDVKFLPHLSGNPLDIVLFKN